jgi:tetratricopeptide (TPR) repeat protein
MRPGAFAGIFTFIFTFSVLATGATASATPPLSTSGFPEQKNYCQPALKLVDQYFDGVISYKSVIQSASAEIEKCQTTNKLGAHLSAAQLASIAGNKVLAANEARSALALAPDESEAHRRLCMALPIGAEKTTICEGMKRFSEESVLINYSLGQNAIGSKNYAEAIRLLNDVIMRRPDYGSAWLERGRTKSFTGDNSGAISDIDKSLELLPAKSADARTAGVRKYEIMTALNRHSEAARAIDGFVTLYPKDVSLLLMRGKAHLKNKQYKLASIDCSAVQKSAEKYVVQEDAKECRAEAQFSSEGELQRKRDCSRFLNFGGKSYEVSAIFSDDGRFYTSLPQMTLTKRSVGNADIEVTVNVDNDAQSYSDTFRFYLTLKTEPYQSSEERRMRARASEIGWYGGLGKHFPHIVHGELVAPNGVKLAFANKDASVLEYLPTGKSQVSSATPEMQHFGPSAFASKRFRLRVWYTSTGATVADEDIFLPTDLTQRLTQIKAAATQLKVSATPGWC